MKTVKELRESFKDMPVEEYKKLDEGHRAFYNMFKNEYTYNVYYFDNAKEDNNTVSDIILLDVVINYDGCGEFLQEFLSYALGINHTDNELALELSKEFWKETFNRDDLDASCFREEYDANILPKTYKTLNKINTELSIFNGEIATLNIDNDADTTQIHIHLNKKLSLGEFDRIMMRAMKFASRWNDINIYRLNTPDYAPIKFVDCYYKSNTYRIDL